MKRSEKTSVKSVLKPVFLALLFLAFSCSKDIVLEPEENLEAVNAKSNQSVLKTLVRGAALHGANGIDIGPDGNLYIASINGQEIVVMNKNSGKIIERFGPATGVLGPDDLVFGPDGTLYWTDLLTGFVGRMTPDGQQLGYQFVAPGVNPIAFSEDGRLFVALDFLGDGLYEIDPNLVDPPRPIIVATEANPFPLGFFNSFDFGDDGRLYGPLFAAGLVISVDVGNPGDPVSTDPFGDGIAQVVAGGFENPAATKFDPEGILTVLDQTGEVFKINTLTGQKTLFTTLEPGLDNMVFDEDGSLYMTNNDQGWVAEILPSGQARYISRGGMILPQGLAVLPGPKNQDALFEADLFRLREFNGRSGREVNSYRGALVPVEGVPSLILPMNLSADGDNLVVSSWFSSGVQVWNPQDGVIEDYPNVIQPIDAVRVNGTIVVSDFGLGGLVYASNNALIAPLDAASGLATDGKILWAADQGTGEIWQIDFDSSPPTLTVIASGLESPEGLALDNDGGLLVVEAGASRLSRIDLSTGDVTRLVEDLQLFGPGLGSPPTWGFDGVAVGRSGDVYISGAGANVIYKVAQNKAR
jgi:sugar lactone lactonase YvrE